MDEEKTVLGFSKFIVIQTLRARFSSILHKGAHNLVPASQLQVPGYVLQRISRGGKFIPTVPCTPPRQLKAVEVWVASFAAFFALASFFQGSTAGMSEAFKVQTAKFLVSTSNKRIEQFIRLLGDSKDQFEPKSFQSNWTWVDRKARQWLSNTRLKLLWWTATRAWEKQLFQKNG